MIEVNFYTAIAVSKYSMLINRTFSPTIQTIFELNLGYALYLAYDMLYIISSI